MCFGPESPLRTLCAVCNGPCGGYNPAECPPAGYSYCHPSAAGYEMMAGVWAAALLPTLRAGADAKLGEAAAAGMAAAAGATAVE